MPSTQFRMVDQTVETASEVCLDPNGEAPIRTTDYSNNCHQSDLKRIGCWNGCVYLPHGSLWMHPSHRIMLWLLVFPGMELCDGVSGLILDLHPANERRRYFVTTSLSGWEQTWNRPWVWGLFRHESRQSNGRLLTSCGHFVNSPHSLVVYICIGPYELGHHCFR